VSGLSLFTAANAWASAAGADHHHVPTIGEVVLPAINFIIYAAVLYYFALPLVRNLLRTRREEVVTTIAQASTKKQQAEALVSEYRAKVAGVEKEVQSIQASRRADAEHEKAKTLSEAEAMSVKIREDARFLADREVGMAREKLRDELADQAESTARELVQKNISAADQSRLAQEFIQHIGQAR
jgi:F-type H+-transporting ATPase subunit b